MRDINGTVCIQMYAISSTNDRFGKSIQGKYLREITSIILKVENH